MEKMPDNKPEYIYFAMIISPLIEKSTVYFSAKMRAIVSLTQSLI